MSINRISFKRLDSHKPDLVRKTFDVVKYVTTNIEYIEHLAHCMSVVTQYENWSERFNEWKKCCQSDEHLIRLLEEMFNSLKNRDVFYDVRGSLLERILEELVKVKYNPPAKREVGCKVKIDNIWVPSDWSIIEKTVDYAGWDGKFGEFYEAKAHPRIYTQENINLLTNLYHNLSSKNFNFIIGCVSYSTKEAIIERFKRDGYRVDIFMFFGRHNLKNLRMDLAS